MNLWHEFHSIFDTNDGSLPEIDIAALSPASLADMWSYLRYAATAYVGDAWFWHTATHQQIPLDSVPNAAQLVVTGEADVFHTVLRGMTFFDTIIPDLGVFVFQDTISLDYRMGSDWNAAAVTALFELLRHLHHLDRNATITLSKTFFSADWRRRFTTAFATYVNEAEHHDSEPGT